MKYCFDDGKECTPYTCNVYDKCIGGRLMVKLYCDGGIKESCFVIVGREPVVFPTVDPDMPASITTNQAEYYSLIAALQIIALQGEQDVEVFSDSQLLVRQLTVKPSGYPVYKTKDLRLQQLNRIVKSLEKEFDKVTYTWIPRKRNLAGKVLEERSKKR